MAGAIFRKLCWVFLIAVLFTGTSHAQTITRKQLREWTLLLRSDDPQKRSSAATSLLASGDSKALEALLSAVGPDQPEAVRVSIITAFGVKGDDRATQQIIDALSDPAIAVQKAATGALASIATSASLQRMTTAALDSDRPAVARTQLLAILGDMRTMDAVPSLMDLLSDPVEEVRAAARLSLEKITLRSFDTAREWRAWWERSAKLSREEMLEDLVTLQGERIRHLAQQVEDLYLTRLKDRKDPSDPAPLLAAIKDSESVTVKLYAIGELAPLKTPAARDTLIEAMSDSDHRVRLAATEALAALGDPTVADSLIMAASQDSSSLVRIAAARSLGALKARTAVSALSALLQDTAPNVAVAAASALGEIADPLALDPLMQIVASDASSAPLCEAAAGALSRIGDPRAIPTLIGLLKSNRDDGRWAAINALAILKAKDAVGPLGETALRDANFLNRERAVTALGQIGELSAVEILVTALDDSEKKVTERALRSLLTLAESDSSVYLTTIDRLIARGRYDLAESVAATALDRYAKLANNSTEALAVRRRMAAGMFAAKEWARARAHLEDLIGKFPKDSRALRDLAVCLTEQGDFSALLALSAQTRVALPDETLYWWQQSADAVEQLAARGMHQEVVSAVDALEKEDADLGGGTIAARLRELRREAREKLAANVTEVAADIIAPPIGLTPAP